MDVVRKVKVEDIDSSIQYLFKFLEDYEAQLTFGRGVFGWYLRWGSWRNGPSFQEIYQLNIETGG